MFHYMLLFFLFLYENVHCLLYLLLYNELYYNDLFLDVVYHLKALGGENYITLLDENELRDAFNNNELSKEVFDHCYEVAEAIMKSIKDKTNKFINRGTKDYLEMKEK